MVRQEIDPVRPDDTTQSPTILGIYLVPALFAIISSTAVALTYILFRDLRKLRYIEIMFYVSTNNIIASIGGSLGPVRTLSPACWFQGITTNANYVIASMWITVLTAQVFLAVFWGVVIRDMTYIHMFIWTVPLLFTLLPLSTNTYGNPGGLKHTDPNGNWVRREESWCFIVTTTDDLPSNVNRVNETQYQRNIEMVWDFLAFYFWIYGCTVACIVMTILILWKTSRSVPVEGAGARSMQRRNTHSAQIKTSVKRLLIYPVVSSICYFIPFVSDMCIANHGCGYGELVSTGLSAAGNVSLLLSGFFLSVAFFVVNPIATRKWLRLLQTWKRNGDDAKDNWEKSYSLFRASLRMSIFQMSPVVMDQSEDPSSEILGIVSVTDNPMQLDMRRRSSAISMNMDIEMAALPTAAPEAESAAHAAAPEAESAADQRIRAESNV